MTPRGLGNGSRVWAGLLAATTASVACGGDDTEDPTGADAASSAASAESVDTSASTTANTTSQGTGDGSGEAGSGDPPPACDPAEPPVDDLCMRTCGLLESCGETFSNCPDTQCCIDECVSLREQMYELTPVCGEIADAMYECVAGLNCRELAMVTDFDLAPTDPCAAEIGVRGGCSCSAPATM